MARAHVPDLDSDSDVSIDLVPSAETESATAQMSLGDVPAGDSSSTIGRFLPQPDDQPEFVDPAKLDLKFCFFKGQRGNLQRPSFDIPWDGYLYRVRDRGAHPEEIARQHPDQWTNIMVHAAKHDSTLRRKAWNILGLHPVLAVDFDPGDQKNWSTPEEEQACWDEARALQKENQWDEKRTAREAKKLIKRVRKAYGRRQGADELIAALAKLDFVVAAFRSKSGTGVHAWVAVGPLVWSKLRPPAPASTGNKKKDAQAHEDWVKGQAEPWAKERNLAHYDLSKQVEAALLADTGFVGDPMARGPWRYFTIGCDPEPHVKDKVRVFQLDLERHPRQVQAEREARRKAAQQLQKRRALAEQAAATNVRGRPGAQVFSHEPPWVWARREVYPILPIEMVYRNVEFTTRDDSEFGYNSLTCFECGQSETDRTKGRFAVHGAGEHRAHYYCRACKCFGSPEKFLNGGVQPTGKHYIGLVQQLASYVGKRLPDRPFHPQFNKPPDLPPIEAYDEVEVPLRRSATNGGSAHHQRHGSGSGTCPPGEGPPAGGARKGFETT